MLIESLDVSPADFAHATGWSIEDRGACNGDVCVPLPPSARRDGRLDVTEIAPRLGMPLVADGEHGIWALGPAAGPAPRVLVDARAPELELPDFDGNPFRLSSLRGQKVLLVAWASW
jgi:hypothetical protein